MSVSDVSTCRTKRLTPILAAQECRPVDVGMEEDLNLLLGELPTILLSVQKILSDPAPGRKPMLHCVDCKAVDHASLRYGGHQVNRTFSSAPISFYLDGRLNGPIIQPHHPAGRPSVRRQRRPLQLKREDIGLPSGLPSGSHRFGLSPAVPSSGPLYLFK